MKLSTYGKFTMIKIGKYKLITWLRSPFYHYLEDRLMTGKEIEKLYGGFRNGTKIQNNSK